VKTGRRQTDLTVRRALALQPGSGRPRPSPPSQAEALRLQETGMRASSGILTQEEKARTDTYMRVHAHRHLWYSDEGCERLLNTSEEMTFALRLV